MSITRAELESHGYMALRQIPDGRWIGILRNLFTYGLCIDLHEHGYRGRYCYENLIDVLRAADIYTGVGDPLGPWIKYKGEDGERLNTESWE